MAQGKLKVKTKVPDNIKKKKANNKGQGPSKRANRPIQPKKMKIQEQQKIKQAVTKMRNKAIEEEVRAKAGKGNKPLSSAQKAVVKHNAS